MLGFGYDHNTLCEEKHPTRQILDMVSQDIPIMILHISGHMACVNSKVLQMCGITRDMDDPEGGVIGREDGGREPNGYLEEAAMALVQSRIGKLVKISIRKMIRGMQEVYIQNGITTIQDGASTSQNIALLKSMAAMHLLKTDVVAYPLMTANGCEVLHKNRKYVGAYHNRLKIGGYKLVLDGSPQGRSAWMTEPYEGEPKGYCAYPWLKDEQVNEYVKKAVDEGHQILAHCNGDAAGDQFITAYEKAVAKRPDRAGHASCNDTLPDCQDGSAGPDERTGNDSLNFCRTCFLLGRYSYKKFWAEERNAYQSGERCIEPWIERNVSSGYTGYKTQYDAFCMVRSETDQ